MKLELQDVYEHYARTSISEMYRYVRMYSCYKKD